MCSSVSVALSKVGTLPVGYMVLFSSTVSQPRPPGMSNLDRNVPRMASIEMSPFCKQSRTALHWPPFPPVSELFGTARSSQGRAGCARRSEPLTARTVAECGAGGKGGRGLRGCPPGQGSQGVEPPGGAPGQRPAHLTARVVGARHPATASGSHHRWDSHGTHLVLAATAGLRQG